MNRDLKNLRIGIGLLTGCFKEFLEGFYKGSYRGLQDWEKSCCKGSFKASTCYLEALRVLQGFYMGGCQN